MDENGGETLTFTTLIWKRSQNSYCSKIPQRIMSIKSAPTTDESIVRWKQGIEDTEVEFSHARGESDTFAYETEIWQRSPNSFAATVPKEILRLSGVPLDNSQLQWELNLLTGSVTIHVEERGDDE